MCDCESVSERIRSNGRELSCKINPESIQEGLVTQKRGNNEIQVADFDGVWLGLVVALSVNKDYKPHF